MRPAGVEHVDPDCGCATGTPSAASGAGRRAGTGCRSRARPGVDDLAAFTVDGVQRAGVELGDVQPLLVGRQGDAAGPLTGRERADDLALLQVDLADHARVVVRDDTPACRPSWRRSPYGSSAHWSGLDDLPGGRVEEDELVVAVDGDERTEPVADPGDALGVVADGESRVAALRAFRSTTVTVPLSALATRSCEPVRD